jgi:hypothetical protein
MSEDKNTTAADDLDVESSEAASVAGGRSSPSQFAATQAIEEETFRLESEGYVADACTTEGTVMINSRGHKVTVKTTR